MVTRLFTGVVAFVERLNRKYSKVGNPPIYENAVFPWTKTIEHEWCAIRAELDRALTCKDDLPGFHELSTDVSVISQAAGFLNWLLLHLAAFTPFIREGIDNQKAWEMRFYEEVGALRNR